MTNCTKEESLRIVEKFWEREWDRIKQINFPKTREHDITLEECAKEIYALKTGFKDNKTQSKTVIKFHSSIIYANRRGCLSPYDYWQKLKEDEDLFKVFYENRLRCSDWFKEKNGKNLHYLYEGYVPEFIYGIGLSTSRKAPKVSYFKPALAKNIVNKYLSNYNTIFDPCCGYSGRLIGSLCAGRNYVGYDINDVTINESKKIYNFIKGITYKKVELYCKDSLKETGEFECLFTCPPYSDIEEWRSSKGLVSSKLSCDEWIDILVNNFKCKKYIFVVDDTIQKYRSNIVEELENTSHFGKNKEYVIEIQK